MSGSSKPATAAYREQKAALAQAGEAVRGAELAKRKADLAREEVLHNGPRPDLVKKLAEADAAARQAATDLGNARAAHTLLTAELERLRAAAERELYAATQAVSHDVFLGFQKRREAALAALCRNNAALFDELALASWAGKNVMAPTDSLIYSVKHLLDEGAGPVTAAPPPQPGAAAPAAPVPALPAGFVPPQTTEFLRPIDGGGASFESSRTVIVQEPPAADPTPEQRGPQAAALVPKYELNPHYQPTPAAPPPTPPAPAPAPAPAATDQVPEPEPVAAPPGPAPKPAGKRPHRPLD